MSDNLQMNKTDLPLGFIDSGLGGLSVLKEALKVMPCEDYIYYGDSANAPYGTKPQEEIRRLTFDVVDKLLAMGIKGLAVACNTATGAAVRALRETYPELPIVGIEPAIKPAAEKSRGGRIVVMATPLTIAQEKYHRLVERVGGGHEIVSVPCAGLMEFVEEGNWDHEQLMAYFAETLGPHITENTESVVLGCTHYPFLKKDLRDFLGRDDIELIDGSYGTAMELRRRLSVQGLLKPEKPGTLGKVTILNSLGDEMIRRSTLLLNRSEE